MSPARSSGQYLGLGSVHLLAAPLLRLLIVGIILPMKLAPPSPELAPTSNSDLPPL